MGIGMVSVCAYSCCGLAISCIGQGCILNSTTVQTEKSQELATPVGSSNTELQ